MTGYAQVSREIAAGQVSVEIRSVNARFLDLSFRIPDELRAVEPALRELVAGAAQRGKIECRIGFRTLARDETAPGIDARVLAQLTELARRVAGAFPQAAPPTVGEILRWPGLLAEAASADALVPEVLAAARQALDEFVASRAREGEKLATFLRDRADAIAAIVEPLKQRGPELLAAWQAKLVERLRSALEQTDAPVPAEETMARVRQEVTAYGLRIDIAEELSRLQAHVDELHRILDAGSPAGKRLDFLLQEFNREANTLGSKAAAIDLTGASIELKVLIEQMREQVQNIE
ncbi:MAG: YicC family protein [Burkholderiales bacterium]|nr:MAG: YicC family protein [Burkholderiales bacterium]